MAMECVQLVLPQVPELQPAQIVEVREDLKGYVQPFRLSLLQLAAQLNAAIEATADYAAIKRAAEFIAATEVYPKLEEVKNALHKHKHRGWWSRTLGFAKGAIDLVGGGRSPRLSGDRRAIAIFWRGGCLFR